MVVMRAEVLLLVLSILTAVLPYVAATTPTPTPLPTPSATTGVAHAGYYALHVLDDSGGVWYAGYSKVGQLGDGASTGSAVYTLTRIAGVNSVVKFDQRMAAGVALTASGAVWYVVVGLTEEIPASYAVGNTTTPPTPGQLFPTHLPLVAGIGRPPRLLIPSPRSTVRPQIRVTVWGCTVDFPDFVGPVAHVSTYAAAEIYSKPPKSA